MAETKLLSTINLIGVNTDKDVKKVAIQKEGFFPILYDIKSSYSIGDVVNDICSKWTLQKPEQYSLQYLDSKLYVVEENRKDIRDGDIFTITHNVEITTAQFLYDIEQQDPATKRKALQELAGQNDGPGQVDDPLFAREFTNRNGINTLKSIIESPREPSDVIAYAMSAMQELLEHQLTTWDACVSQFFVEKVIDYANNMDNRVYMNIVQRALALLDNIVSVSNTYYVNVTNKVASDPSRLVKHLSSNNESVQLSAVSLCNSMMLRMDHDKRKEFSRLLFTHGYHSAMHSIVESAASKSFVVSGMAHQLYVYQFIMVGLYEHRMNSKPDFEDVKLLEDLNKIYDIAFESSPSRKEKGSGKADFTKLGFQNGSGPLVDFAEQCPPGILAYDVMMYFTESYRDQYIKIIMENVGRDGNGIPFGKSTQNLTNILCELLEVGSNISDACVDFQPMVFSTPKILEELYCVAIQLLNKTWKEMRATLQDFPKVINIVKDQLKRVFSKRPETVEKFKTEAFSLNYQALLSLKEQEANERSILDSGKKPVIELREKIEPGIRELVRQQRLALLVDGTYFRVFGGKDKNKSLYCCVSPNHRFLHHIESESNDMNKQNLTAESIPNKIPISEITRIEMVKDSPKKETVKALKKQFLPLSFSIYYEQEEHLDLIAPNEEMFGVWTDALSFLIGKEAVSDRFQKDIEMLLNMEMKLLLLDLENVNIPDVPLEIPPEPEHYDFYYSDN